MTNGLSTLSKFPLDKNSRHIKIFLLVYRSPLYIRALQSFEANCFKQPLDFFHSEIIAPEMQSEKNISKNDNKIQKEIKWLHLFVKLKEQHRNYILCTIYLVPSCLM